MEYNFEFLNKHGHQTKKATQTPNDFLSGLRAADEVKEREERRLSGLKKANEKRKRTNTPEGESEA